MIQLYLILHTGEHDSGINSRSRSGSTVEPDHDEGNSDSEVDSETDSQSNSPSNRDKDYIHQPKKPKRTRTAFSNLQLDQLEYTFDHVSQYPDVFVREELSKRLGIKEDRIQVRMFLGMPPFL